MSYLAANAISNPAWRSVLAPDAAGTGVVISLGGDGTFLRAAEWVADRRIPVLGVNSGHLGFLANYTPEEAPSLVADLLHGNLEVESRMLLKVDARNVPERGLKLDDKCQDRHRQLLSHGLSGRRAAYIHSHRLHRLQSLGWRTDPSAHSRMLAPLACGTPQPHDAPACGKRIIYCQHRHRIALRILPPQYRRAVVPPSLRIGSEGDTRPVPAPRNEAQERRFRIHSQKKAQLGAALILNAVSIQDLQQAAA